MKIEDLLRQIIPDPSKCRAAAERLRKDHPGMSPLELAHRARTDAQLRGAATGAATGIAASPLLMLPAALADMLAMLKIEGTLAGVVGALLDPASLDDSHILEADVIAIVFPAAVSQAFRQVGLATGEQVTQRIVRKYLSEDLLKLVSRLIARFAGRELTREAILTKAVPLLGAGIGAGWNWLEVRAIGSRAISYYQDRPIGPSPKRAPSPWVRTVRRLLPGKPQENDPTDSDPTD